MASAVLHAAPHSGARSFSPNLPPALARAALAAKVAADNKGQNVVVLDMRAVTRLYDYFVIATGSNPRQTKSIHEEVLGRLKADDRLLPRSTGGMPEATWIVDDYLDVVLHVFTPETREHYRLEDLWNDVPKLEAAATA